MVPFPTSDSTWILPPRSFKRLDMMEVPNQFPLYTVVGKLGLRIRLENVPETLRVDTNPVRDDDLETDSPVLMVDHSFFSGSSGPIENCEAGHHTREADESEKSVEVVFIPSSMDSSSHKPMLSLNPCSVNLHAFDIRL
jgi:hypothetical protein